MHPSKKSQDLWKPCWALKTPKWMMMNLTSTNPSGILVTQMTLMMMMIRDLQEEDLQEAGDDHQEEVPQEAVPQEEEEEDHLVRLLTPTIQTPVTLEQTNGCQEDLKDHHHPRIRLKATTKQDSNLTKESNFLRSLHGMVMVILS